MLRNFLKTFQDIIFIEKFSMENGFLQKINPIVKLFTFAFLIITIILLRSILLLLPFLIILLIFSFLSHIPFKLFFLRTSIFIPLFAIIIALPLSFITPGTTLIKFNLNYFLLMITLEGILKTIQFIFKIWICVAILNFLVLTTKFSEIIKSLQFFKIPNLFIFMTILTYRFIFLFIDEAYRMLLAKEARTIKKQRKIDILKTLSYIITNLFIRAFERGERAYLAMKARGFSKSFNYFKIQINFDKNYYIFLFIVTFICLFSFSLTLLF